MIANYAFYRQEYKGSAITQEEWNEYEATAESWLRYIQDEYHARLRMIPNPEKMAICAIAETLHNYDLMANGEGGAVSSASIGSVSVSYGTPAALDVSADAERDAVLKVAKLYLDFSYGTVMFL